VIDRTLSAHYTPLETISVVVHNNVALAFCKACEHIIIKTYDLQDPRRDERSTV
jgi:hypothetical protein